MSARDGDRQFRRSRLAVLAGLGVACVGCLAGSLWVFGPIIYDNEFKLGTYQVRLALPDPTAFSPARLVLDSATSGSKLDPAAGKNASAQATIPPQSTQNAFEKAFASLTSGTPSAPTQQLGTEANRLVPMDVNFSLASAGTGQDAANDPSHLEVRKAATFNGASVGAIRLRVGSGTQLWLARADLERIAQSTKGGLPQLSEFSQSNPYVSFARLRASGLAVSYDPASDKIEISS